MQASLGTTRGYRRHGDDFFARFLPWLARRTESSPTRFGPHFGEAGDPGWLRLRRTRGTDRRGLVKPVHRGDGVVLGNASDSGVQQGGRIYEIFQDGRSIEEAVDRASRVGVFATNRSTRPRSVRSRTFGRPTIPGPCDVLNSYTSPTASCTDVRGGRGAEAAVGAPLRLTATAATGFSADFSRRTASRTTKHR